MVSAYLRLETGWCSLFEGYILTDAYRLWILKLLGKAPSVGQVANGRYRNIFHYTIIFLHGSLDIASHTEKKTCTYNRPVVQESVQASKVNGHPEC